MKHRKHISGNNYGAITKFDKNAENGYHIIIWTSDSFTFQYSHKIGRDVIKAGMFVCYTVYLNIFSNFKQWYNPYEKNKGKTIVRLNTVALTKVKVKPINYVALPAIASNRSRGDAIRLDVVYVCDFTHDKILDTIFSR